VQVSGVARLLQRVHRALRQPHVHIAWVTPSLSSITCVRWSTPAILLAPYGRRQGGDDDSNSQHLLDGLPGHAELPGDVGL
jgi:hypothetical protein